MVVAAVTGRRVGRKGAWPGAATAAAAAAAAIAAGGSPDVAGGSAAAAGIDTAAAGAAAAEIGKDGTGAGADFATDDVVLVDPTDLARLEVELCDLAKEGTAATEAPADPVKAVGIGGASDGADADAGAAAAAERATPTLEGATAGACTGTLLAFLGSGAAAEPPPAVPFIPEVATFEATVVRARPAGRELPDDANAGLAAVGLKPVRPICAPMVAVADPLARVLDV